MSKRFSRSPDPRNDLFSSYNRSTSPSKTKNKGARSPYGAAVPGGGGSGYGYSPSGSTDHLAPNGASAFSAYPGSNSGSTLGGGAANGVGYRSATPNSRGQYSAQALEELESQNEEQVGVLTGKVKMLKDLTVAIGDEIRTSTTLADKMNDQFEASRLKIRGTMTRMLRMAEKTGVGWKVWVGFFAVVIVLFWYVWLF
ncbi:hypothetical protein DM02DRAFT_608043 [Periconia macrospinosa]|uniref:t-SNARE coiled-coil homology domain-containing protein n=1 Tax=Periconia macrospinosa TaxID=97972 RepID=A0A2V1EDJ4_9PLEO|nr:hypothetical protein DM02DRAFT_608043 [Periconia macrospinosa]